MMPSLHLIEDGLNWIEWIINNNLGFCFSVSESSVVLTDESGEVKRI